MSINLPNICHAIQFKISNYIILPKFFQWLGRRGRDASQLIIAIVFVKMQQILLDDMYILKKSAFKDLQLPGNYENWDQSTNVIIRLYYEYIQSKM